jgi:transposase
MKRMVDFAGRHQVNLRLAYYPPYHSKYNPIERTWGVLANHWNGNILDEIDTVLQFARSGLCHRFGHLRPLMDSSPELLSSEVLFYRGYGVLGTKLA